MVSWYQDRISVVLIQMRGTREILTLKQGQGKNRQMKTLKIEKIVEVEL